MVSSKKWTDRLITTCFVTLSRVLLGSLTACFLIACATPYEQLRDAVEQGNLEQTRAALDSGAGPSDALDQALQCGQAEVVRLLLDRGADPNACESTTACPLHRAVSLGRTDLVQLLLEHGADPNIGESDRISNLMLVDGDSGERFDAIVPDVGSSNVKTSAEKIPEKPEFWFKIRRIGGKTPLHIAIDRNDLQTIRVLLDHGADSTAPHVDGGFLLCPIGLWTGMSESYMQQLLEVGADIRVNGCTILRNGDWYRAFQPPHQSTFALGSAIEYARAKDKPGIVRLLEEASARSPK
jgi:ankyrin repeat protein